MVKRSDDVLTPRNGHTLIVGIVCRISGCQNQQEASLEDQADNARQAIAELYEGPVEIRIIAYTMAKGEALDRPELIQIEAAYRSGECDVIVYDDLGRLIRGGEAVRLLGIGVDHGTRTHSICDGIDTVDPNWEQNALAASSENVAHNERTSQRIKQKTMNRFKKFGHTARRPIAGYIVPEGVTTYDDHLKDETANPIIQEGKDRLMRNGNASAVADWFNQVDFKVGPGCKRKQWDGHMVREFYRNTLLKGMPQRGKMHSVKKFGTGRRKSVVNPKGPTYYSAPHLAHLDPAEFDALNEALDRKNAGCGRKRVEGKDALAGVSRNRSRFPGHCARCWYCGYEHVWGGNGIKGYLMCKACRTWNCWNSTSFNGQIATRKVVELIRHELAQLEGFDAQFRELVELAQVNGKDGLVGQWQDWHVRQAAFEKANANVEEVIISLGMSPKLKEMLDKLQVEERKLAYEKHQLESLQKKRLVLPESPAALQALFEAEFARLGSSSYDLGDLLRQLVPEFFVYLVRLCDGGHLYARAKVKLNLAGTFPDVNIVPELQALLTKEVTIDLWDAPPQREQIREQAVRLAKAGGLTHKQIGERCTPKASGTAVGHALALHEEMLKRGLESPWLIVLEPPSDYSKLRLHRNAKYEFKPLEGYERPPL